MSTATEELMRRAEELATDVDTEKKQTHPDSVDYQLLEKALPLVITAQLLLMATTDAFKDEQRGMGEITVEDGAYRFDSVEQMSAYIQRFGPLKDDVPVTVAGEKIR